MSRKIPVVQHDEVADILEAFFDSCRNNLVVRGGREINPKEAETLRKRLHRRAVVNLLDELVRNYGMSPWRKAILTENLAKENASAPRILRSITTDANSSGNTDVLRMIGEIRRTLSPSAFKRLAYPIGVEQTTRCFPLYFWIQLGAGGVPYLRIWAGFRSRGSCASEDSFSTSTLKDASRARMAHATDFTQAHTHCVRVEFGGAVHAFAFESELRLLTPIPEKQLAQFERFERYSVQTRNVMRVLAPSLHQISGRYLNVEIPVEPRFSADVIRHISPLQRGFRRNMS